jgi:undecaprenyl diphosphate synthase
VSRVVQAAPQLGIGTLTLFAFSSDNWRRPVDEITNIMRLLACHLRAEAAECYRNGVQVRVIGRRDRIPADVLEAIRAAEILTGPCNRFRLRLAIDYSSRDAILAAAARVPAGSARQDFERALGEVLCLGEPTRPIDLLIRTGGEQRISDFMLWESAYAELYFTPIMWPDFDGAALASAVAEYHRRERRYGAAPANTSVPSTMAAD